MASLLRVSAIVLCLVLVMFFALKPEPEVPRAAAPEQVRIYLNSHDALRNQLAFGLFGAAALFSLKRQGFFNRRQVIAVCLIALLIPALELAQIWMPGAARRFRRRFERLAGTWRRLSFLHDGVMGLGGFLPKRCEKLTLRLNAIPTGANLLPNLSFDRKFQISPYV